LGERKSEDRAADAITSFSGSMAFVYLHVAWFSVWVLLNTGRLGAPAFDPFFLCALDDDRVAGSDLSFPPWP